MDSAYERFIALTREVCNLRFVGHLLGWDQETLMPEAGADARAEQIALIAALVHDRSTSAELGDALGALGERLDALDDEAQWNVRRARYFYDRACRVPR